MQAIGASCGSDATHVLESFRPLCDGVAQICDSRQAVAGPDNQEFHRVRTDPEDDEQASFSAARFLTNRNIRAVRDNANKMLEGFDLPTQSLMRHMGAAGCSTQYVQGVCS